MQLFFTLVSVASPNCCQNNTLNLLHIYTCIENVCVKRVNHSHFGQEPDETIQKMIDKTTVSSKIELTNSLGRMLTLRYTIICIDQEEGRDALLKYFNSMPVWPIYKHISTPCLSDSITNPYPWHHCAHNCFLVKATITNYDLQTTTHAIQLLSVRMYTTATYSITTGHPFKFSSGNTEKQCASGVELGGAWRHVDYNNTHVQ